MIPPPPIIAPNGIADWSLDSALKRHVAEVLTYTEGNATWAAEEMGINPSTLTRWMLAWADGRTARLATKGARRAA